jgi:hypothetical protein
MAVDTLEDARAELAEREGITTRFISQSIGWWSKAGQSQHQHSNIVGKWAEVMDVDAVVWTELKPKFRKKLNQIPTADEVISFLQSLPPDEKRKAEEYVRMAPRQVNTAYRRRIEKELNWTPAKHEQ